LQPVNWNVYDRDTITRQFDTNITFKNCIHVHINDHNDEQKYAQEE